MLGPHDALDLVSALRYTGWCSKQAGRLLPDCQAHSDVGIYMKNSHMPFRKQGAGQKVLWQCRTVRKGLCICLGCQWAMCHSLFRYQRRGHTGVSQPVCPHLRAVLQTHTRGRSSQLSLNKWLTDFLNKCDLTLLNTSGLQWPGSTWGSKRQTSAGVM